MGLGRPFRPPVQWYIHIYNNKKLSKGHPLPLYCVPYLHIYKPFSSSFFGGGGGGWGGGTPTAPLLYPLVCIYKTFWGASPLPPTHFYLYLRLTQPKVLKSQILTIYQYGSRPLFDANFPCLSLGLDNDLYSYCVWCLHPGIMV